MSQWQDRRTKFNEAHEKPIMFNLGRNRYAGRTINVKSLTSIKLTKGTAQNANVQRWSY